MRMVPVVIDPPVFGEDPGLQQGVEKLLV